MSTFRSTLQKMVFQPDEERLIDVVQILPQPGKKQKKELFMCIAMTLEQPFSIRLYIVKADRNEQLRKRDKYALRDVRIVDGINPRKALPEFKITILEQTFTLTTSTYEEKEKFIRQLYKFAHQYLPVHKPEFINIQLPVEIVPSSQVSCPSEAVTTENLPITTKEETDFRNLLKSFDLTVGDAKKFTTVLNEKLILLDGANIASIMGNEQAVTDLINLMDDAIGEVTCLEEQLNDLDNILLFVRDSVELIEEKDSLGQVERQNTERLRRELEEFIFHLDMISKEHIGVLQSAKLSDPTSINQCSLAARAMNQFLRKKTDLNSMAAYQERVEELHRVRDEFVDKFFSHITALFDNMSSMMEEQEWDSLMLQIQTQRYRCFLPYCELVAWLKSTRFNAYNGVLWRYVKRAKELYAVEFKRFFDAINQRARVLGARKDFTPGVISPTNQEYINLLETIMGETRNVVEAEQKFCVRFFQISGDLMNSVETRSNDSVENGSVTGGPKTMEKHFNDQVKSVIQPIFSLFLNHLCDFIDCSGSQNIYVLIMLYVSLSKKMQSHQDTASYFSGLYGSSMILFKQRIDQLVLNVSQKYESYHPTKKVRIGILPTIGQFEALAKHSEMLFKQSGRRADLEKWLEKLVDALFKGINNVSDSPYSKSPPAVVRLENFHELHSTIADLRIKCLDAKRKEAKNIYLNNVDAYVHEYMGRPLERIHVFFELIERAIEGGIRPEEIGFQQHFSRAELKKVVSAYPGKEVKKGLENLYKKVEKHLTPGSLLLQVVWRQMQNDFLKQLKVYQTVIGKCYPSSRIDLEVSITDVLQYFSEIAQQH